ncbi:unnamed protein product [Musa hybrid cultivar]
MQQLRLLLAGEVQEAADVFSGAAQCGAEGPRCPSGEEEGRGRCSSCDCYWPGSEEDTVVRRSLLLRRECFPPCVTATESVCCRQQIGEGARPAKKSKTG